MKPELAIYRSKDGDVRLDAQLERKTIWLSQAQLADLVSSERSVDHWQLTANGNLFIGEKKHTFFGQFENNSNVNLGVRYSF